MATKQAAKREVKQPAAQTTITVPALAEGEILAGLIFEQGAPKHWVILLAGDLASATWKKAVAWAAKQGGELPTRKEQSLLFANAGERFEPAWYWSGEQHAGYESCAWYQVFSNGFQLWTRKDNDCRARAVRRVPIQ